MQCVEIRTGRDGYRVRIEHTAPIVSRSCYIFDHKNCPRGRIERFGDQMTNDLVCAGGCAGRCRCPSCSASQLQPFLQPLAAALVGGGADRAERAVRQDVAPSLRPRGVGALLTLGLRGVASGRCASAGARGAATALLFPRTHHRSAIMCVSRTSACVATMCMRSR